MHSWSSELDHFLVGDMSTVKSQQKTPNQQQNQKQQQQRQKAHQKNPTFKSWIQNILMIFPEHFYPLWKNIFTTCL